MSSNPCNPKTWITGVETIKRQVGYGWLVVGQSVIAGLAYDQSAVRPLSVTWTAPLQLRYAACGAIQVLYAFAFVQMCCTFT